MLHLDLDTLYYLKVAANLNNLVALENLAVIYSEGKYINKNIEKAIHYYTLASNQNDPISQFILGQIYFEGKIVPRDIDKAIHYLKLSANNEDREAQLYMADFYFEGIYIEYDIQKAIHYYKEVSFKYAFAKNNLGIIYKNGLNGIESNKYLAKVYFTEAIRDENDFVAMFNLANIILDENKEDFKESIDLLVKSSHYGFDSSQKLFILLQMKRFSSYSFDVIHNELCKYKLSEELIQKFSKKYKIIIDLLKNNSFESLYQKYRLEAFIYIRGSIVLLEDLNTRKPIQSKHENITPCINNMFYEGFGNDLL